MLGKISDSQFCFKRNAVQASFDTIPNGMLRKQAGHDSLCVMPLMAADYGKSHKLFAIRKLFIVVEYEPRVTSEL